MIDACSSTIFADTDAEVGAALVGVIEEGSQRFRRRAIPAVVAVPGDEVRDVVEVATLIDAAVV